MSSLLANRRRKIWVGDELSKKGLRQWDLFYYSHRDPSGDRKQKIMAGMAEARAWQQDSSCARGGTFSLDTAPNDILPSV